MAYFDKYEAKANYIDKLMTENAEVETLTEEQHDALAAVCRIRHEIHSHPEALFYSESADYNRFWEYIDDTGNQYNGINQILKEVGLPTFDCDISVFNYSDDCTYIDMGMTFDEAIEDTHNMVEHFNDLIENYLRQIDKEHGTHYAPTGHARNNF